MAPKIVHDRAHCEGFFVCTSADPDRWDENGEEDKVDLVGAREVMEGVFEREIDEEDLPDAATAAEGCPVGVIKVLDDDGSTMAGPRARPVEQ